MSTFVSVGNANQPFFRLIKSVVKISPSLPQPVIIQHGHTPCCESDCITRQFMCMEEFNQYLSGAELLILHAGAGSVINAVQSGKIPIVMPRRAKYDEHIDDHQLEFACALAGSGKVVLVEEPEELILAMESALRMQDLARDSNVTSLLVGLVGEVLGNYAEHL
jgi:UDP-N-acetylglucosamine transferase subunit ALG13